MLVSLCLCGAKKAGSIKTILVAGSNGIVDIIWVVVYRTRILGRSNDGKRWCDISLKLGILVEPVIRRVDRDSVRRYSIGLMIVGRFDKVRIVTQILFYPDKQQTPQLLAGLGRWHQVAAARLRVCAIW